MIEVDLAIVGAGLAGCALTHCLGRNGFDGKTLLIEAGRGPGGRASSRRHRDDSIWRIDHGAPVLNFSAAPEGSVAGLLHPLFDQGVLVKEHRPVVLIDDQGEQLASPPQGVSYAGAPTMASVSEALLQQAPVGLESVFGCRLRWLNYSSGRWMLADSERSQVFYAKRLALTGTLLAHPRSLAMLDWGETPLRSAVPQGADRQLDSALEAIAGIEASVRWNLMLALPSIDPVDLPRQIWLSSESQQRWGIERLVLQPQGDGRLGLVVHGLDDGQTITPESQPGLMRHHEERQRAALPVLLRSWPLLHQGLERAESYGVMRWGAAVPLSGGLPAELQWCPDSDVGFAGDWIKGPGYGHGEGALRSAMALAEQLKLG
mgnify:FL=1